MLLIGCIAFSGCLTVTTRSVVTPSTGTNEPVAVQEQTRQTTIEIDVTLPQLPSTEPTSGSLSKKAQVAVPSQYAPKHVQRNQPQVAATEAPAGEKAPTSADSSSAPEIYIASVPKGDTRNSDGSATEDSVPLVLTSTPATSTPATSAPATSAPATSAPATATPATATPATATLAGASLDLEPIAHADEFPPEPPTELTDVSLASLELVTFSNHPSLSQAVAQIRAERGRWVQAGLSTNPEVGFSGQQLGSGGEAEQVGVYIGKTIIRGGKQSLDQAVRARRIRAAEQQVERMRLSVKNQLHQAYYHLGIAYQRQRVSADLVEILTENLRLTQVLYDSKEVGQVDVLREKMNLEVVTTELEKAKRDVQGATERLRAVLGESDLMLSDEQLETVASSLPAAENLSVDVSPEEWSMIHPDLAIAAFNIEAARWQVEREQAENFSDLNLQMVMQYDESTKSGNGNLQISGPLRLWNKNQGAIQAAYAELTAAQRQYEATERRLNQEFAVAFAKFHQSREQVARYTRPDGVLQMSRESVELLKKGVEVGEFNRLALFLAQKERMQHELAYIEALATSLNQKADLESLLIQ